jgi:hypothetical protein
VKTAITTVVLIDSDGAHLLAAAKGKARELYERLTRTRQSRGAHRYEVTESEKTFYVSITVNAPFVQILVDSKKCPKFVSGLVWIEDFFEPTVREEEVDYLRSIYLKEAPTSKVLEASLANNANQMLTVRAGMYSGEMRKVVQVLQGMGRTISYNYRASETHGVFRTGSGAPWIIKISRAGVFAWPMNFCRGPNSPEALGYTPLPTAEPEEPRELLSAEVMESVYEGKGGFYSGSGWAFSASGAKAANCFVGSKDIYSHSWQYVISIAAGSDGAPTSATVTLAEEGYIHGPKATHMKFPRAVNPLSLYSFDPFRGNTNYRNDCVAPVFCFYDGESLQTFFYLYAATAGFNRTDDPFEGRPAICAEFLNVPMMTGSYGETPVATIALNSTRPEMQVNDNRRSLLMTLEGPLGVGFFANEIGENLREAWWRIFERNSEGNAVYNKKSSVLIVTAFDREAAYLAHSVRNSHDGFEYSLQRNGISRFNLATTSSVACLATGALGAIEATAGANRGPTWADDSCQSNIRLAEFAGLWYVSGASTGSTVKWSQQVGYVPGWNGCLQTYESEWKFAAANISQVKEVIIEYPPRVTVDNALLLYGSDSTRGAVPASDSEISDWMQFIESGLNDQTAFILRDCLTPSRFAYSKTVNNPRGKDLVTSPGFGPYSMSPVTGATLTFVGVP